MTHHEHTERKTAVRRLLTPALVLLAGLLLNLWATLAQPGIAVNGFVTRFDANFLTGQPVLFDECGTDGYPAMTVAVARRNIQAARGSGHDTVVAIVRVLYNENVLDETLEDQKAGIWLYSGLGKSGVETTTEVLEVMEQTGTLHLQPGDTLKIREPYCLIDDRMPILKNQLTSNNTHRDYVIFRQDDYEWDFLLPGETYLVFGQIDNDADRANGIIEPMWNSAFCLSKPGTLTMERKHSVLMSYDVEKYGLTAATKTKK